MMKQHNPMRTYSRNRKAFKRSIRELEGIRVNETAFDLCCYALALGAVLAVVVTLC